MKFELALRYSYYIQIHSDGLRLIANTFTIILTKKIYLDKVFFSSFIKCLLVFLCIQLKKKKLITILNYFAQTATIFNDNNIIRSISQRSCFFSPEWLIFPTGIPVVISLFVENSTMTHFFFIDWSCHCVDTNPVLDMCATYLTENSHVFTRIFFNKMMRKILIKWKKGADRKIIRQKEQTWL